MTYVKLISVKNYRAFIEVHPNTKIEEFKGGFYEGI